MARNALLNFVAQGAALVVGVVAVPFIVRGLGTEQFGLLSLAWVILGFFTVFDLGMARATTKFVAEALSKRAEAAIPSLVWTAVTVQAAFGLVGAVVLAWVTPLLTRHVLNIPPQLEGQAYAALLLLALSLPVVLVFAGLSGVLEAAQRFDLLNAIRIPSSISTYLLPLLGLGLGFDLPGIVALIGASRFVMLGILVIVSLRVVPALRRYSASRAALSRLFAFGTWVMLTNLIVPVFVYLDRLLVGSLLNLDAVAYYAAPYDLASKLLIVPSSVVGVLFPAFSGLAARGADEELGVVLARSTKYIAAMMVPLVIVLWLFSDAILQAWLGPAFALHSTGVLRVLGLAVLINSLGYAPFALVQAAGRPRLIAIYHLLELPLYALVAVAFIVGLGIEGAALAWLLRMAWTIPVFFAVCARAAGVSLDALLRTGAIGSVAVGGGFVAAAIAVGVWGSLSLPGRALVGAVLLLTYAVATWRVAFDVVDKDLIRGVVGSARRFVFVTGGR